MENLPFGFMVFWVGYVVWLVCAGFAVNAAQDRDISVLERRAWVVAATVLCIAPFVAIGMS